MKRRCVVRAATGLALLPKVHHACVAGKFNREVQNTLLHALSWLPIKQVALLERASASLRDILKENTVPRLCTKVIIAPDGTLPWSFLERYLHQVKHLTLGIDVAFVNSLLLYRMRPERLRISVSMGVDDLQALRPDRRVHSMAAGLQRLDVTTDMDIGPFVRHCSKLHSLVLRHKDFGVCETKAIVAAASSTLTRLTIADVSVSSAFNPNGVWLAQVCSKAPQLLELYLDVDLDQVGGQSISLLSVACPLLEKICFKRYAGGVTVSKFMAFTMATWTGLRHLLLPKTVGAESVSVKDALLPWSRAHPHCDVFPALAHVSEFELRSVDDASAFFGLLQAQPGDQPPPMLYLDVACVDRNDITARVMKLCDKRHKLEVSSSEEFPLEINAFQKPKGGMRGLSIRQHATDVLPSLLDAFEGCDLNLEVDSVVALSAQSLGRILEWKTGNVHVRLWGGILPGRSVTHEQALLEFKMAAVSAPRFDVRWYGDDMMAAPPSSVAIEEAVRAGFTVMCNRFGVVMRRI